MVSMPFLSLFVNGLLTSMGIDCGEGNLPCERDHHAGETLRSAFSLSEATKQRLL